MVGGSLRVLQPLPTTKTGRHDIAEILLKVALNTTNKTSWGRFTLILRCELLLNTWQKNKKKQKKAFENNFTTDKYCHSGVIIMYILSLNFDSKIFFFSW